jgi:hypothetical protein
MFKYTRKRYQCLESVRTVRSGLALLAVQVCRVDAFGVASVGTVRETTEIVTRKSLLFSKLVFFDASKQFLGPLVCGESVLWCISVE